MAEPCGSHKALRNLYFHWPMKTHLLMFLGYWHCLIHHATNERQQYRLRALPLFCYNWRARGVRYEISVHPINDVTSLVGQFRQLETTLSVNNKILAVLENVTRKTKPKNHLPKGNRFLLMIQQWFQDTCSIRLL